MGPMEDHQAHLDKEYHVDHQVILADRRVAILEQRLHALNGAGHQVF